MILVLMSLLALSAETNLQEKLAEKKAGSKEKTPQQVKETMNQATKTLKESGIEKNALQVNAKVPNFNFTYKGKKKKLSDYYKHGAIVVHFYRGGWCPYCMLEMKAYEKIKGDFQDAGVQVLHFTPDTPSEIEKTRKKHDLTGIIVSDTNNKIAKKLGLAFRLDKKVQKIYDDFGIDLEKSQGNKNHELPMPAVYVVDKKGMIRYAYLDADYTNRAEPSEVLKEAKKW